MNFVSSAGQQNRKKFSQKKKTMKTFGNFVASIGWNVIRFCSKK